MKIRYSTHLKRRIKERKFPQDYPRKIYQKAKFRFFDRQTMHNIALSKLKYAGKQRYLAISYDIVDKNVMIITIHPVSEEELKRKLETGRWKKV